MSTTYDPNIPDPTDSPANDVQTMQNNAMAIYNIWTKDHYTFENADNYDGLHAQVTIPANNIPMSGPTGLKSIIYTQPGLANTAASQLIGANSAGAFPLSSIVAFGTFLSIPGTGTTTILNGFNLANPSNVITVVTARVYPIILKTGILTGTQNNIVVIPYSNSSGGVITYTYDAPSYTLTLNVQTSNVNVNFIVLQA